MMSKFTEGHDHRGDIRRAGISIEESRQLGALLEAPVHAIHVMDHDPGLLHRLFDVLSDAGYRVNASSDAEIALDYIARSHPEIVLASMEMPDVAGLDLLGRIKRISPETRVVMTSVRADWQVYEDVLHCGGAGVLAKPIHEKHLLRAVERVLER
jgi:two-component system chemotaxis response regulator CheY